MKSGFPILLHRCLRRERYSHKNLCIFNHERVLIPSFNHKWKGALLPSSALETALSFAQKKIFWPPMPAKQLYILRPQNDSASFVAISTTNRHCFPPLTVNGNHFTPTPRLRNTKCKAFCILLFAQRCIKNKIRICRDPIFSTILGCTFTHFVGYHW